MGALRSAARLSEGLNASTASWNGYYSRFIGDKVEFLIFEWGFCELWIISFKLNTKEKYISFSRGK